MSEETNASEETKMYGLRELILVVLLLIVISAATSVAVIHYLGKGQDSPVRVVDYGQILMKEKQKLDGDPTAKSNAEEIHDKLDEFADKLAEQGYLVIDDANVLAYPAYMHIEYDNGNFTARVK